MPRISKKRRVLDYVAARGWVRIGEAEWNELRAALPEVSVAVIQGAGLEGVEIGPPWAGVRQHTLGELERSLNDLGAVYESRPDLASFCRQQVIRAKDRARGASRNHGLEESRRQLKKEMVEWMLVWLGDPRVFPAWAKLRRERMEANVLPASACRKNA